jgi:ribosomal protein S18 acetylase RimI-like enzyme
LSLCVEHQNIHAKRLYQRLGFEKKQSFDTHELLSWSPINQQQ